MTHIGRIAAIAILGLTTTACMASVEIFEYLHGYGFVVIEQPQRGSTLPGGTPGIACIAPLEEGGVLVARSRSGENVWRVANGESDSALEMPDRAPRIRCVATHEDSVFIGTEEGVFVSRDGGAGEQVQFVPRSAVGTFIFRRPGPLRSSVKELAIDDFGNVWLATDPQRLAAVEVYSFPAIPSIWYTDAGDERHEQTLPPLYDLPRVGEALALAAGDRAYACFRTEARRPQVLVSKLPAQHMTQPLAIADQIPPVIRPVLAVAADGGLWLAGEEDAGVVLLRITDESVEDMSPPAELMGRARVLDIATDDSRVYLATDSVGVLVRDETGWRTHPVTEAIRPMRDMSMKAAEQLVVDGRGDLWVASNRTLLHWSE